MTFGHLQLEFGLHTLFTQLSLINISVNNPVFNQRRGSKSVFPQRTCGINRLVSFNPESWKKERCVSREDPAAEGH